MIMKKILINYKVNIYGILQKHHWRSDQLIFPVSDFSDVFRNPLQPCAPCFLQ